MIYLPYTYISSISLGDYRKYSYRSDNLQHNKVIYSMNKP